MHTMRSSWTSGARASDFEYTRPNGSAASFADLWAESSVLFVWTRHPGSRFFAETLAQLRAVRTSLRERGAELAVVVQARPEDLRALCGAELLCVADPRRVTHAAFGLEHASPWRLLLSLDYHRRRRAAARSGFHGNWRRALARESDLLLAPGAALVARGGRILWMYRGEHPADLPSADNLLAVASEFATTVRR